MQNNHELTQNTHQTDYSSSTREDDNFLTFPKLLLNFFKIGQLIVMAREDTGSFFSFSLMANDILVFIIQTALNHLQKQTYYVEYEYRVNPHPLLNSFYPNDELEIYPKALFNPCYHTFLNPKVLEAWQVN